MNLLDLMIKVGVDDQASEGIEKVSGNAKTLAGSIGDGLARAAEIGLGAVTAAAGGVAALTTAAVNNFAEYEQLVGGAETLFKTSADTLLAYADGAYETAGLSANNYLETVTSFAASLISSLDGDTAAATAAADQAITDMADNANKMGSSIESIQNAYMGFAKQNYSMLDNLKLGYGGTQAEMYRLMQTAAELDETFAATAEFSLDEKGHLTAEFADITQAIHIVQTEMGITGTTALEASETISGSASAAKAAWENLVTGIADENADFEGQVTAFVDATGTALDNILPRVEIALTGAADLIDSLIPVVMERIPALIDEYLPRIAEAAVGIITSLVQGVSDNTDTLSGTALEVITYIATELVGLLPQIVEAGLQLIVSLASGVADSLPELIPTVVSVILQIVDTLTDPENLSELLKAALTLLETLAFGLVDAIPELAGAAVDLIVGLAEFLLKAENLELLVGTAVKVVVALAGGLISAIPEIATSAVQLIDSLIAEFTNTDWLQVGKNLVNEIWDGIKEVWESLTRWFSEAWDNVTGIFDGWFGDDDDRGRTPRYASGTPYHPGGLAWVGEEGPELVELPRGTRVYSAGESADMIAGGGDVVNNYYFSVDAGGIRELNDLVRIAESARVDLRISGRTK